jgi:hypothetical protein
MKSTKTYGLLAIAVACIAGATCSNSTAAPVNFSASNNKPRATLAITSIDLVVGKDTIVTPPPGWTLAGTSGNWQRYVGNLPVGGNTGNWNGTNPTGTSSAIIAAFDYANGDTVSVCPDPVSAIAIPGGPSGTTYLGYAIPAQNWGYFYEVWNTPDFTDSTLSTTVELPPGTPISNLQVINNSFPISALMEVTTLSPSNTIYEAIAPYMNEADALGTPGVATTANYDQLSGQLMMGFPSGMGAGQAGSVVGFTSSESPMLTSSENVSSVFFVLGQCPETGYNYGVVPSPEPGTIVMLIMALGLGSCCRFNRKLN